MDRGSHCLKSMRAIAQSRWRVAVAADIVIELGSELG